MLFCAFVFVRKLNLMQDVAGQSFYQPVSDDAILYLDDFRL